MGQLTLMILQMGQLMATAIIQGATNLYGLSWLNGVINHMRI